MYNPDYSTYRSQMKNLNPDLQETEIYSMWKSVMEPGWNVQTSPAIGVDGLYHFLYITERLDDGKIYVGKHSTRDLNDGYQGSGYDIQDGIKLGKRFKTTKLHFFKTENEAYAAEKNIVNLPFINSKYVLNHVGGGISDKPDPPSIVKKVDSGVSVVRSVKGNAWSFSRLNVPVGSILVWEKDKSKTCVVMDDWTVEYDGKKMNLPTLDKLLGNGISYCKNTLNSFSFNGKTLAELKEQILDKSV